MIRKAHGNGTDALLRVETAPVDELPNGVHEAKQAEAGHERTAKGTWTKGARTAQSKGGKSRKEQVALAARVGFVPLPEGAPFAPYNRLAASFRREHCRSLAKTVGGGVCGTGPSSMVASAALALAASRYLYDNAHGDPAVLMQAAQLADKSRQALLTAHELCAREAQSRPREDSVTALRRRMGVEK